MAKALRAPKEYLTPFHAKSEWQAAPAIDAPRATPSGRALQEHETILHIEIREFDALHQAQQVVFSLQE